MIRFDPKIRRVFLKKMHLIKVQVELNSLMDLDLSLHIHTSNKGVSSRRHVEVDFRTHRLNDIDHCFDRIALEPSGRIKTVIDIIRSYSKEDLRSVQRSIIRCFLLWDRKCKGLGINKEMAIL